MYVMTQKEFTDDLRAYCVAHADPGNIVRYSRFFRDGFHGYGLTSQQVRAKAKELVQSKLVDLAVVAESMPELMESQKYEEASLGLLVYDGLHRQYTRETLQEVSGWFSMGISNWAHADMLGMWILPRLMAMELAAMADFNDWLTSGYKFQRRCVPVTFIKLLKKRETYSDIFEFLEPLMMDPDREVHQGMGWFLREAWKIRPAETESFLLKWKDSAPRLIYQYACEKMTPTQKLLFKRVK
jgi:3-methyladenine DNA glycosylase AlkD